MYPSISKINNDDVLPLEIVDVDVLTDEETEGTDRAQDEEQEGREELEEEEEEEEEEGKKEER